MSSITDFNTIPDCNKIDPDCIAADTSLELDEENLTGLCLNSPWGSNCVNLLSVVKAGETVTHLSLSPEPDPECLVFEREDGDSDCIHGDDLSRIISMKYLKDVDQTTPPSDGIVYMFNEQIGKFEPYDLKTFINNTNITLGRLQASIVNLQNQINDEVARAQAAETALGNRISAIENAIYNWGSDKNTKIPRGNINIYSDYTNNNNRTWGIFTHSTASGNEIANDEYFS